MTFDVHGEYPAIFLYRWVRIYEAESLRPSYGTTALARDKDEGLGTSLAAACELGVLPREVFAILGGGQEMHGWNCRWNLVRDVVGYLEWVPAWVGALEGSLCPVERLTVTPQYFLHDVAYHVVV